MKNFHLVVFLYCFIPSFSQNQVNIWYWGMGEGVDFNSGSPVILNNGQMFSNEGCAVISDANGNLLFYTNGVNVWNRNHAIMPGSQMPNLYGHVSSSQGVVIVPKPCDSNIYYIFIADGCTGNCTNGCVFSYSIVDMTLQGGLGDVSSKNNILINWKVGEHVAAVHHSNGKDVWVITHDTTNRFFAYLVTTSGIQPPVISSVGPFYSGCPIGYIKFSPDGKKLLLPHLGPNVFDFDNTTGIVSNPFSLGLGSIYGSSFSPNSSRLYVNSGGTIYQYNMLAGTPAQILASKTTIASIFAVSAMQNAPDGKIYIAKPAAGLDVINNPNALGIACNYSANAVAQPGTQLGLPNFIESYFDTSFSISSSSPPSANAGNDVTICLGNSATLTASGGGDYSWNTSQTSATIVVSPTSTSSYTVTISNACGSSSDSVTVIVQSCSSALTVSATGNSICSGDCITLSANVSGGVGPFSYLWNPTGQTTQAFTDCPTTTTVYTITVTDANGNTGTDTTIVSVIPTPTVGITGNTTLCLGDATTLTATGGNNYLWNNSTTINPIVVSPTSNSTYTVIAFNGACSDTDSVFVTVTPTPTVNVTSPLPFCAGNTGTICASGGCTYLWNTGATTSCISVSVAGTYTVYAQCGSCVGTGTVNVTVNPNPTASVSGNTTICTGDMTTLIASGGNSYSWSNGATSSSITINPSSSTNYTVTVFDINGCNDDTSIIVNVLPPPTAHVSNDTICSGETAILVGSGGGNYSWSTGETTSSILVSSAGTYSVIVSTGSCSDTAVGTVVVNSNPVATILSNTTITAGQNVTLTASGGITYSWNNAQTGSVIIVSPTTTTYYCVVATDQNFCTDTACVTVTVEPVECSGDIFIPNAFSPNDDGMNDYFKIRYPDISCIKELHIVIYNRWGEKVFESNKIDFEWDGIYNEKAINSSVLVYYITVVNIDNQTTIRKGNISLVK